MKSVSSRLESLIFLLLPVLGFVGLYLLQNHQENYSSWNVFGFVGIGIIGAFRWSLFFIRIIRSWIYTHWVFPKWRKWADKVPVESLPHMCFMVPTYKEKDWISERVFRAIVNEAKTLAQPVTVLVNSSSDEENAQILAFVKAEDPEMQYIQLIQMTQKDGKRKAMADGLRHLATLGLPSDTVVALMDGDSELTPGTLRKTLAFFRMFPRMGALTTDELPIVNGSYFFSEWFHLRFAQRHYQMCSDSLSRKVMCLTGRFSLFRCETAFHPTFIEQLQEDSLDDWLWGRFKFLSGDDKSTWFWLLQRGYDMLYIPDATVYSIETISGSVVDRSYQNMRRWYGNMLRNSTRAMSLGPNKLGWFIWYNLLDQRISIWTSLLTPGLLLGSLLQLNWGAAGILLCWILLSRPIMLLLIFWDRVSDLKPIHFPLLLLSQWSSSLVKIWTQMNLAKQSWTNRGIQVMTSDGEGMERTVKLGTSRFLLFAQIFSFILFLAWLSGTVNPSWDIAGLMLQRQASAQPEIEKIEAVAYNVLPNDGKDDAAPLQALIDRFPSSTPVEIELPIGELDLFQPLEINRGNITLKGQGIARTILRAHFEPKEGEAILVIKPNAFEASATVTTATVEQVGQGRVSDIEMSGFTLRPDVSSPDGEIKSISLQRATNVSLSRLYLERGASALALNQTDNVKMEYVVAEGGPLDQVVVMQDAINTQMNGMSSNPPS
ncbi:MAG: glycosyltransferase family 2 protein [Leptolyngbyaceae cyanobacterium SL_7_1]|nr:glycosyltransferase family 2 protein [Leptolyngbyaceae cyanobacterium SL_7_1]